MKLARPILLALLIGIGASVPASTQDKPSGYLAAGEFDAVPGLKPAPRPGDPQYEIDRSTFLATRKLEGSPRWELATNDAQNSAASMLRDYSCAVGTTLTPENAPKLLHVIGRAGLDTSSQVNRAKELFARKRPFEIDQGAVCEPTSHLFDKKAQRMSYDYPSGHAAWGWTWATILAAIAPDRAQQILARGKAYGASRVVCGAHNASSIDASIKMTTATMAAVAAKADYKADLAAARAELTALRAGGTVPQACDAEAALIAQALPKPDYFEITLTNTDGHLSWLIIIGLVAAVVFYLPVPILLAGNGWPISGALLSTGSCVAVIFLWAALPSTSAISEIVVASLVTLGLIVPIALLVYGLVKAAIRLRHAIGRKIIEARRRA